MSNAQPLVYLLDVEGTVAPVSLIYEQLFPYARRHMTHFLSTNSDDPGVRADLLLLSGENAAETDQNVPKMGDAENLKAAIAYLDWLMDRDRKSTALKSIQGKIWKFGFEAGELVGTVFDDVPDALGRWSAKARVAIYSSGSVEAQQLLFRHSSVGDLTPLVSAYFDTKVGAKRSAASFTAITGAMGVEPAELLFVSDVVPELDAAREAGCQTILAIRPGNGAVGPFHGHPEISSFSGIP